MITMKKCMMYSVAEAMAILTVMVIFKSLRHGYHAGICRKAGGSIDERLKESKSILEKAAMHLQSAFEHLKNLK